MPQYGLGFDTGGTYTDAVIIDMEKGDVVCCAKSLTTRNDLSLGIAGAIKGFDKELFKHVTMVSISSTLATNSIVEGKGCRVALICAGREFDHSIPVDYITCIQGGHTLRGEEDKPLDEAAARSFLESVKGKVDGVAISTYLSVRNPEHELRLRSICNEILNVPVVCGHELSSSLGFNERTTTCIMNTRLLPIIRDLMVSVKKVMSDVGIDAPMMIVKGDGSIMSEKVALDRPIETILSGPAASLIGAKNLTGANDAIVVDIGGTTTDIGILRNGTPRLEKEGAVIGGRRTRVMAAEIATSGIGGDSRIIANSGEFILSPLRIVPLCIASSQYPELKAKLVKAAEAKSRYLPQCMRVDQIVLDTEFFVKIKDIQNSTLTDDDRTFLEAISQGPMSLNEVAEKHGIHPFSINVGKMEELGMVQRIGMTPTDLLHAEGSYVEYDAEASQLGVRYMSRLMRMTPEEFIRVGKLRVMEKIAREILKKLYFEETGELSMDKVAEDLTNKFITGKEGLDYSCSIRLNKPLIGIGAPVRAWLPKVAEWFNTQLLLSEYSHVGNAVGAITGNIIEKVEILIKPFKGEGGSDDPRCTVFASFGRFDVQSYKEAIEFAKTKGGEIATEKAKAAGADTVEVSVEMKEKRFGFDDELGGEMLIETEMTVSAVGKPKEFRQKEGRLSYYVDLNQRYDMG